jgi:hypothetical protein
MKNIYLFTLIILFAKFSFSQIEINIYKIDDDSLRVIIDDNIEFEMFKPYQFIIKTDVKKVDSLYLNMYGDRSLLENDKVFEKTFDHHIYEIMIFSKKEKTKDDIVFRNKILNIKGVKFILKVDGKQYFRHIGDGDIGRKSILEIEFISDIYDLKDLEIKDPVYFSYKFPKLAGDEFFLDENYKISVKVKKLKVMKDHYIDKAKKRLLFIVFPQVYYKGKPLLPEKPSHRMAIIVYHHFYME